MKNLKKISLAVCLAAAMVSLASCGNSDDASGSSSLQTNTNEVVSSKFDLTKKITRYSRDTTSGTRDGFFTAINFKDAIKNDDMIPGYVLAADNGTMIQSVKNDQYGIGYISLSTLESSGLNAVKYQGVEATEENVVNGTYKLSRNFNYITREESDCDAAKYKIIKSFQLFMTSQEGLAVIKNKDGILTTPIAQAKSFSDILAENPELKAACEEEGSKITVYFGGSTSVEKIAKELTKTFATYCKRFEPSHNHTGSGDAYKCTQGANKNEANKLDIGFLSRELSSTETAAEGTSGMICKDGIVVVVNKANDVVKNATAETLKAIYETKDCKWSDYFSK